MVDHESQTDPDEDAVDEDADDGIGDNDGSVDVEADEEISLDALTAAYAGLVGDAEVASSDASAPDQDARQPQAGQGETDELTSADEPKADDHVSPLGILEAVLFVGNTENTPLTAKRIAALMRGVSPREIDELVIELNDQYRELECPYEIVSQGAGYLLNIREQYANLRDRFYGSVREARLSQSAIDILAVIAYGQPLTREEIDTTRGRPSGGILSQLVRRQLLRIERPEKKPRRPIYFTTERFLTIMGLADISELPESQEFDRSS